jgi:heme/copper-type cytochrome/quinol oxidase subunit 2
MGIVLIVGQCVISVVQDMAEELLMHEADFPASLLLGMEGLFGLIFGLMLYFHWRRYLVKIPPRPGIL